MDLATSGRTRKKGEGFKKGSGDSFLFFSLLSTSLSPILPLSLTEKMEAKTQEKQQTSAVSQSESPTTSKQDASPSSQVTQQPKKEGQDLQTLLDQQLSTFESFFDRLNDSSFSQLDPLLSNDPLFSWQIRPLSLYPDVFTKSGLEYEKGEIGNVFRQMKEKLLKDVQVSLPRPGSVRSTMTDPPMNDD